MPKDLSYMGCYGSAAAYDVDNCAECIYDDYCCTVNTLFMAGAIDKQGRHIDPWKTIYLGKSYLEKHNIQEYKNR